MTIRFLWTIVVGVLATATVSAQSGAPTAEQVAERQKAAALVSGSPAQPGLARSGADAILEGASDDSKATARIGVSFADSWSIDSTISSPLDKQLSRTAVLVASKHPLATDARFTVGASRTFHRFGVDTAIRKEVCDEVKRRNLGPCDTRNERIPQPLRDRLSTEAFVAQTSFIVGTRFTLGRSEFKYRDSPSTATIDVTRTTPIALTAGVGALFPNNWFTSINAGVERTWKAAGDPQTLCAPVAIGSTTTSCEEEVTIGTPGEMSGAVLAVEARRFFDKLAIAPRFEYRRTKQLKLFEAPVYFLSDPDKGGWTGGVVFRVKNGEASIAVFVGAALPYFGLR